MDAGLVADECVEAEEEAVGALDEEPLRLFSLVLTERLLQVKMRE